MSEFKERLIKKHKELQKLKDLPFWEVKKLFASYLQNDEELLRAWHSNFACWLLDNCGKINYEDRNNMASKFLKSFFELDYNWEKLMKYKEEAIHDE